MLFQLDMDVTKVSAAVTGDGLAGVATGPPLLAACCATAERNADAISCVCCGVACALGAAAGARAGVAAGGVGAPTAECSLAEDAPNIASILGVSGWCFRRLGAHCGRIACPKGVERNSAGSPRRQGGRGAGEGGEGGGVEGR